MGLTLKTKAERYKGPGTTLMKVPGILMIIFGVLSFLSSMVTKTAISMLIEMATTAEELQIANGFGGLGRAFTFNFIVAALTFAFGIISIVFSRRPEQYLPVFIIGAIVAILTFVFNILYISGINQLTEVAKQVDDYNYASSSSILNVLGIVSSLLLPGLSMFGAWKNKQSLGS
ncbi:MAG: hypothetical protein QM296_10590 [Bacillota bacterium]|nr:hypothetical protein [Bacillota bacterium]